MKKVFLLILMLTATMFGYAESPKNDGKIVITPPQPPTSTTTPLSLNRADIEATYFMGAITFVFNEDLGNCDIEVFNINTGEVWNVSHSGIGSAIVYTSDSHGTYYIYIDTDCGGYSGEYTN